ncbi:hypothetical protein DSTSK_43130 [Desulforhabdus sp. TSK]|nr:hypothetical protein DSTSK_43130 [Desulforhabdus sp. TSK]
MPRTIHPWNRARRAPSFDDLMEPTRDILPHVPALEARGNRPLQMSFEEQLRALVYFHLEEHTSGRHLMQALQEDDFAREHIAPAAGIKRSSFCEAINSRGLEQLISLYGGLQAKASRLLPCEYKELGNLVSVDGSFIQAVLSMAWADYRDGSKKAKVHVGFDINRSIPTKIFLTDGKADERPFVSKIVSPGQTGVLDRYYQCHKNFDLWQQENRHFVCRIRANTNKICIEMHPVAPGGIVFYDATVLLGTPGVNQTEKPVRVVGYQIGTVCYWVATDRHDLSAEQIAMVYKLRWEVEKFFAWWKRHLRVYHLIARSEYGLMVQIMAGLITYLLLALYCHKHHNEKVSINRVRELRIQIQNEIRASEPPDHISHNFKEQGNVTLSAKT